MIRRGIIALALIISGAMGSSVMFGGTAHAATQCDTDGMILTLKPWYYGLTNSDCTIQSPSELSGGIQEFVIKVAFNIVEDLIHLIGYATIGFIIYGGFIYMTSSGSPERATKGRKTVTNAAVGLFIAIAAAGLVNFVAGL